MEVLLLGSGSADGWPNPFCTCASCASATARGELRGPTAALVDGVLLLDCGPEAPRAALRAGRDLAGVTHVLLSHDHPDHASPMALLARTWARRRELLTVVAAPPVLERWRPWAGPDDPVAFVPAAPGDLLRAGAHVVRVLPAAHTGGSGDAGLLFEVRRGADRLLYATDTGPLPEDAVAATAGAAYDLVLLEETCGTRDGGPTGHLDLATFAAQLERLRAVGAVVDRTEVVAVHLSHDNPPDLGQRLAAAGARPGRDLEVLRTGRSRTRPSALVLGGARSGKSAHAEALLRDLAAGGAARVVATGPPSGAGDAEWDARVAAHRARRPAAWTTLETRDVAGVLRRPGPPVLVECCTLWLTARLDAAGAWDDAPGWQAAVAADVEELAAAVADPAADVVLVSNEVGWGVVPASASGRLFRDWQGRLNARLAQAADRTVLLVAGRPLELGRDR